MRSSGLLLLIFSSLLLGACEPRMALRLHAEQEAILVAPTTEISLVEDVEGLTPVIIEEVPDIEEEPAIEEEVAEPAPPPPPPPPSIEEQMEALTSPIYFQLDAYALNTAQIEQLQKLAIFLSAEANSDVMVRIEGHCDDRGTREYNFALGSARASAIASILTRNGIPKDRISTISYGKERPAFTGTSKISRARNRRGDIFLRTPLN